jgi:hypothetical protein
MLRRSVLGAWLTTMLKFSLLPNQTATAHSWIARQLHTAGLPGNCTQLGRPACIASHGTRRADPAAHLAFAGALSWVPGWLTLMPAAQLNGNCLLPNQTATAHS